MTITSTPANILVVDDTPANLNVLTTILAQQGYKVRPANSGEVAILVAQKALPDLILLDIQMPGLNGIEVCKRLKGLETTRHIPIIFISALDEALDKVEAFEVGGADYITKPFQILEVLARVEHQLALDRQRRQITALGALGTVLRGQVVRLGEGLAALDGGDPLGDLRALVTAITATLDEFGRLTGDEEISG